MTRDVTAVALHIPSPRASIDFRAYEETLNNVHLLIWLLRRMRASLPTGLEILCICESGLEHSRVSEMVQTGHLENVTVVCTNARTELLRCREVITNTSVHQLVVSRLAHAFAPARLIHDLLRLHTQLDAHITDAVLRGFPEPLFVVNRELIDRLVDANLADGDGVLRAVAQYRHQHSRGPDAVRWIRFDIAAHYRIDPTTVPESNDLASQRDVEIYREAFRHSTLTEDARPDKLLAAHKRAITVVRQRRLTHTAPVSRASSQARERLRVLYASSISTFTGAQQSLCHLIGAMRERDVVCYALTSYSGTFTTLLRKNGAKVLCPNHNIAKNDPENFVYAQHVLSTVKPHLVHVNHTVGLPTLNAVLAAGIPLVQHARFQTPELFREHFHVADAIIAVSDFVGRQVKRLDVDPSRVHVIVNGVDVEAFAPAPSEIASARARLRLPADDFVVLLIARFARNKRHDVVIDAIGRLRRRTGRGHLLFVGAADGDPTYLRDLLKQAERDGVTTHMTIVDFLEDIRLAHYASNVVALPSEDEPLSRAILEGMAFGLPVVVGDSGGTKEIITSGFNGFVIPCGDASALADVLVNLAQHNDLCVALGEAALTTIRSSLTASQCAERTLSIYERVLRERGDLSLRSHVRCQ